MRRKINLPQIIIIIFALILLVSVVFIISKLFEKKEVQYSYELDSDITYNNKKYERDTNIEAYLIVGLDKYISQIDEDTYYNDQCSDFILLLSINHKDKKITAFQINRDTMTDVYVLGLSGSRVNTKTCQIALSHCYGSGDLVSLRNTSDAVSNLTGLDISNYMAVTMDAISIMTDYVGGVPVTIEDDFTDVEDSFVMGEKVTLTGSKAILFVQSRSAMKEPTNIARMARQRQYINSLIDRLRVCNEADEDFTMNLYTKIASYICFNNSQTQINNLIEKVINYEFAGIVNFSGESKEGEEYMEFWPDKNDIKDKIINSFYREK